MKESEKKGKKCTRACERAWKKPKQAVMNPISVVARERISRLWPLQPPKETMREPVRCREDEGDDGNRYRKSIIMG